MKSRPTTGTMRWICYFLILTSIVQLAFSQVTNCPRGWSRIGEKCYRIKANTVSYRLATVLCLLEGGLIASINTRVVFDILSREIVNQYNSSQFWVSPNSSIYQLEVTTLGTTQSESISTSNHCVTFNGMVLSEKLCYEELRYICEHDLIVYKTKLNCLPDRSRASFVGEETGHCLFRSLGKVVKEEADAICQQDNAHAIDLDDIMRDGLLNFQETRVMANDGSEYWTGLTWQDDKVIWKSGDELDNFNSNARYLEIHRDRGHCITVQINFTNLLETHLHQTDCEDLAYAVCAKNIGSQNTTSNPLTTSSPLMTSPSVLYCPTHPSTNSWKRYSRISDCFWETSYETGYLSWDDAKAYCRGFGGDLASFHNIDEERFGLSFQYGSLKHSYWIGLRLDTETLTYKWSDGTPLDYENWAPGHPDHKDKTRQCVAMDASEKHWISSLCGILSWFVCRVPQRQSPPAFIAPYRPPLRTCSNGTVPSSTYYYDGYCYYVGHSTFTWHRAKQYCEDEGSSLLSLHSPDEVGFVLRLIGDEKHRHLDGNRVWIGLNTLTRTGAYSWTDHSPFDFTYWNENEPNNYLNQEKCTNMYMRSGLWNDENCNAEMSFVCKRPYNATNLPEIPTTEDPTLGHCQKGWYAYHDRCYYPVGYAVKDRVNWTTAMNICSNLNGSLASIRNKRDQAFLAFLLQGLKTDAWIGLHDTIESGSYYWMDNSELRYTNWAPGEPSFFVLEEDCVKMAYSEKESGVWRDDYCSRKLAFFCQTGKEKDLPEPAYNRGLDCLYPQGWLKLEGFCFKMFPGNNLSWIEAENSCQRDGGHLVSVSDSSVQAVVSYLSTRVNTSFWIGLKYEESTRKISWLNGWPMTMTNWEKNEPTNLSEKPCFASSLEGLWRAVPCSDEMPYICQITTGKPPLQKRYTGDCQNTTDKWVSSDNSFCYIVDHRHSDWYTASLQCYRHVRPLPQPPSNRFLFRPFRITRYSSQYLHTRFRPTLLRQGSLLASMHSVEDVEAIRKILKPGTKPFFIGLRRTSLGGFEWSDKSPVDFVNWDLDEPENGQDECVEMSPVTMKWRVVDCHAQRHFLCASKKVDEIEVIPENARFTADSENKISSAALTGILVCAALAIIAIVAAVIYYKPLRKRTNEIQMRGQSVSFENALYNADSASLEFQNKEEHSLEL
ncbi:macrophage mannose receptor 1-like isoform X2 [Stegodyphus dumicola]|uniref:macrophage mannose receptor 1-like isoform X2 n=1 Tax=Stegodyphus dumicola TaxID=202533 RepID=UPI0015A86515|nr:macrophage mannose receptor 1-like isoform X2 [Stegodyphus dumicola]